DAALPVADGEVCHAVRARCWGVRGVLGTSVSTGGLISASAGVRQEQRRSAASRLQKGGCTYATEYVSVDHSCLYGRRTGVHAGQRADGLWAGQGADSVRGHV